VLMPISLADVTPTLPMSSPLLRTLTVPMEVARPTFTTNRTKPEAFTCGVRP
jgi:hypothetical protein